MIPTALISVNEFEHISLDASSATATLAFATFAGHFVVCRRSFSVHELLESFEFHVS